MIEDEEPAFQVSSDGTVIADTYTPLPPYPPLFLANWPTCAEVSKEPPDDRMPEIRWRVRSPSDVITQRSLPLSEE